MEDIFKVYFNNDELINRTVYRLVMYLPALRFINGGRAVEYSNRVHYFNY